MKIGWIKRLELGYVLHSRLKSTDGGHREAIVRLLLCCLPMLLILACDRGGDAPAPSTQATSNNPIANLERVGQGSADSASQLTVCLFTRSDCPISNSYAPEVRRIHEKFKPRGVGFYLVYADPDEGREIIEKHVKEYSYPFPALRDPKHELVKTTGAKVTPEAAVFDKAGKLLYRGRIDDRYVDFGKAR